jgi:nucleoside-diphosphate-sugar epimerase
VKALVTGSAGFLGRHFTRALLDRGAYVVGVDVRPTSYDDDDEVEAFEDDVRDWFRYDEERYDLVVHLAGVVGGRAKIEGDPLALAVNLEIDTAMFRWAARTKQPHVVYMSSSAAYPRLLQEGDRRYPVLHESELDVVNASYLGRPDEVYGWAKLNGEYLAQRVREVAGTVVTVMRPFSGYGADQDLDYPFPSFIKRARDREDPFIIWGDGEQVRDFVHVDDVVGATLAAVEAGYNGPMNVASGRPTSFNDLQKLVCQAAGYDPEVEHITTAPRGVEHRVGSPDLMERYYRLTVSLEQGIERALDPPR